MTDKIQECLLLMADITLQKISNNSKAAEAELISAKLEKWKSKFEKKNGVDWEDELRSERDWKRLYRFLTGATSYKVRSVIANVSEICFEEFDDVDILKILEKMKIADENIPDQFKGESKGCDLDACVELFVKMVLNLILPNQSLLKTGSGDEESIVDAQLQQRNKNLRATISSQVKELRAEKSKSKKLTELVEGLTERLEALELNLKMAAETAIQEKAVRAIYEVKRTAPNRTRKSKTAVEEEDFDAESEDELSVLSNRSPGAALSMEEEQEDFGSLLGRDARRNNKRLPTSPSRHADVYDMRNLERAEMDFPLDGNPPTMVSLTGAVDSTTGLRLYDLVQGEHVATMVKEGKGKRRVVELERGPLGRKHVRECGMNDQVPHMLPRSAHELKYFWQENERLLFSRRDRDGGQFAVVEDLHKFKERFEYRVKMVMGDELGVNCAHHVTLWSVLSYFLVVTWNRALCRRRSELLWRDFDVRWEANFGNLCRIQPSGATVQGIAESMKWLCYYCENTSCGARGMCSSFCCQCETGIIANPNTVSAALNQAKQAAYISWKAGLAATADKTMKAFLKAHPQYGGQKAPEKSKMSVDEAYDYLSKNQEIIRAPSAARF